MLKHKLVTAIIAGCVLSAASAAHFYTENMKAKSDVQDKVVLAWYKDATVEGCKVSNFLANGSGEPRAVWTCPDGRAILQPQRLN